MKLPETASLARYSSAMRAVMLCQDEFGAFIADDGTEPADVALDTVADTATFTFAQPLAVRPRAAGGRCLGSRRAMMESFA